MANMDMVDQIAPRRKALVDALGGGNTGINGTPDVSQLTPPPAAAPSPLPASPLADAASAAPAAPKPFQSGNASVSGYLQDAMNNFAPTIRGIKDEAGRKSALKDYLTSISPEVQSRGGTLTGIGNSDKAQVNGRTIDFFGDIEGAATPQYLDVTDPGPAPQAGGGMALPMLGGGDAQSNIQAQLAQLTQQSPNLAALIKQLGGQ